MSDDVAAGAWPRPSTWPALAEDEVHVWRVALGADAGAIGRGLQLLSDEERARAARFHQAADRERYVAAHAALRSVLAGYLGARPAELGIGARAGCKPRLLAPLDGVDLRFSLAHAGQWALCAVARGREVGVDLEPYGRSDDLVETVLHALAPDERRMLANVPVAQREACFFRLWTCKEAYLKATGEGLSRPLDSFAIGGVVEGAPRLLWVRDHPDAAERWSLLPLDVQPGYAAALVAEGHGWRVRRWAWRDDSRR